MKLAVIVPFFQRQHGLLKAAVNSVILQRTDNCRIRIIIVDDESPVNPLTELMPVALPHNIEIDVIRRKNGGPGPARNTGLDAIKDEDLIAFLDSDDTWSPEHLEKALDCFINTNCNLYFCDSQMDDCQTNFRLAGFPFEDTPVSRASAIYNDVFFIGRGNSVEDLARDYISHTSTVIFRNTKRLAIHRFDERFRLAGEDHMMWAKLSNDAGLTCFSSYIGSIRGHGVDLFRSIYYRDRARWLQRNCSAVLKYREFQRLFRFGKKTSDIIEDSIFRFSIEILKTLARPSAIRVLADRNAIVMLFSIFPYPWLALFRYVRNWSRYTNAHWLRPMRPLSHSNGHDAPWLTDEVVPGDAAVVDDVVVGLEDAVREPVVAHELPDVLDRVELGASRRQQQQGDVGGGDQFGRTMPASLIEDDHGVGVRRDVEGDLSKMHGHRLAVAAWHDHARSWIPATTVISAA